MSKLKNIAKFSQQNKDGFERCENAMQMNLVKRLSFILTIFYIMTAVIAGNVPANAVEPSNEEYTLSFSGVEEVFFSNAKAVDLKTGKEIYLTYTVEKIRTDHKAMQHGVVGT